MCSPCRNLLSSLTVSCEEHSHEPQLEGAFDKDNEEEEEEEVKLGQEDPLPLEIKIMKEEPLDDAPDTEPPGAKRRKKAVKKEPRKRVGTNHFPCPQEIYPAFYHYSFCSWKPTIIMP